MAIVKMKRITLIAENKNKKQILDELMWLSSVDITPVSYTHLDVYKRQSLRYV